MKKRKCRTAEILLIFLLAMILAGCGCQAAYPTESTQPQTSTPSTTNATTEATTRPTEVVEITDPVETTIMPETTAPVLMFPDLENKKFTFTSGAGAWYTVLYLESDGSFTGEHTDSDMGDIGDGYPNGIKYIANFTGRFSIAEQIDENRYKITLEELVLEKEPGEEWIEDGVKHITVDAGLYKDREYIFVMPDLMRANLPEGAHIWLPDYKYGELDVPVGYYGIIDVGTGCGYFNLYKD